MMHVFGKYIGVCPVVAATVCSSMASAGGHGHGHDDDDFEGYRTRVRTEFRGGPANYHQYYANIKSTVITIEDFWLRTNDGKVYKIPTDIMTIDLQDLKGFKRGLVIDLNKAKLPQGITQLDVVEIETKVNEVRPAYYNAADGSQCRMKVPKFLNFYTTQTPMTLFPKFAYYVKVDFSALNSIQVDVLTQITQKEYCEDDCDWFSHKKGPNCRPIGKPVTRTKLTCELANRRQPIMSFVRTIDEA